MWLDQDISSLLRKEEELFIKAGLGVFLDHLLIGSCSSVKSMNRLGAEKMLLNILVLQQNLRNLVVGGGMEVLPEEDEEKANRDMNDEEVVTLTKSENFWRLFLSGPDVSFPLFSLTFGISLLIP